MKLLNSWKRTLSLGLLAASGVPSTFAQDVAIPAGNIARASYMEDGAHPSAMAGSMDTGCADCGGSCDGSCGDMGCDNSGGLFGRRFGDGCGPMGAGPSCEDFGSIGGQELMCRHCGFRGCARCGWGLGLLASNRCKGLLGRLAPYSEGGLAAQRWFDVAVEGTAYRRDKGAAQTNYSSQGTGATNIVLGSNAVDLDNYEYGLSVIANLQTGVGSNLEAVYFGLNQWEANAAATSTPANSPTLFSFISNFGTSPLNGFDDPDRSFRHALDYESAFHNGEINFRRRWVGSYNYFQGSWLAGIRYFDLDESLTFSARGENNDTQQSNGLRFFDYTTQVRNQLTGFQVGGDLWLNVIPGINTGVELKTGVFGNHSNQGTTINANSINNLQEGISDGRTAFLAQASITTVYRLTYSWAVRGSYNWMYIDNVALAPENFNSTPPAIILPNSARAVTINNDAEIIYSGFTLGAEYLW